MPDWTSSQVKDWKEKAKSTQQYYGEKLGDREYDNFPPEDYKYVKLKIAFAMFGGPSNMNEDDEEVKLDSYNDDQQKIVNTLFESLKSNSNSEIKVAFIFIPFIQQTGKDKYEELQVPVMRFISTKDKPAFLDQFARVYSSWNDFTEWNELPECLCCYPRDGMYSIDDSDKLLVDFKESPRCFLGEKIVKVADVTSTVTTFTSLGLLVGGGISSLLFPPAAPALLSAAAYTGAASGVYSVGRNTTKLVDRGVHDQSVNPFTDAQARSCWLGAVGGALGVGTLGASQYITYLAREGEVASKVLRATFNTLNVSSLTVNGIGIVSNIYDLSQKDKVTVLDVANLSLSILFFANSAVSMKTARTLIKETQTNVLNSHKNNLDTEAEAGLRAFMRQNKKELRSTMYGNAKTIKGINKIHDSQQFFQGLQQARTDMNVNRHNKAPDGLRIRVNDDLLISVNNELKIHPTKWKNISQPQSRSDIVNCVRKINANPDNAMEYIKDIKKVCGQERISFERTRQNTLKALTEDLKLKDLSINGKHIFKDLRPYEIDRIGNVLEAKGKHGSKEFFDIVTHMAKEVGCKSAGEYMGVAEYCFEHINEIRHRSVGGARPKIPDVTTELKNSIGVEGGRMQEMINQFQQLRATVGKANSAATDPRFATDAHATYHYYKHKMFGPKGELEVDAYFDILKEITGKSELRSNTILNQEGDKVIATFTDPAIGAKAVVIEPIVKSNGQGAVAATLFYDKRVLNQQ